MFALIWGTLGLIWIKEIYPAMSRMIEKIPKRPGAILTILLVAFMLFDGFISCAALTRANERAEGIPATSSFQMFLDKHLDDNYRARLPEHAEGQRRRHEKRTAERHGKEHVNAIRPYCGKEI